MTTPAWAARTARTTCRRAGRSLLSLVLLALAACAVNPATGERQLSLVGEEREIQMGREADESIVASMGVVEDEALQSYLSELGQELAAVSERPDLPWTFRVIDDPTVNAFALPGGFIYVTRGMMAHLNNEAQLVGILGHEIGHVTARHSVNRMSRAQLANLGLGLGMVLVPELRDFGQLASAGMQLLFLRFSREDEHQSDELGVRYMTRLGYEPAELSRVFAMLERKGEEAGSSLPSWASTHPQPDDRQARILAMDDTLPDARTVSVAPYMERVDGLVFGSNPRHGYFEEGVFHHPEMAFRFDGPEGWQGMNGRQQVQLVSPDEDAVLVLRLAGGDDPAGAADAFSAQEGVRVTGSSREELNGLPSVRLSFTAATEGGTLRGLAVFPELDGRVYAFYGIASSGAWSGPSGAIRSALGSFREETDPGVLGVQPDVLDVVELDATLSVAEFMERYSVRGEAGTVALINQAWESDRLSPGPAKRLIQR